MSFSFVSFSSIRNFQISKFWSLSFSILSSAILFFTHDAPDATRTFPTNYFFHFEKRDEFSAIH